MKTLAPSWRAARFLPIPIILASSLVAACALNPLVPTERVKSDMGGTHFTLQDQQIPARDFAQASRDSAECRSGAEREAAFDPDDFDVPPHLRVVIDLPRSANVSVSTAPGATETSDWWEPHGLPPLGQMPEPRFDQPLHERAQ